MIQHCYNQPEGTMHAQYDCNYWMCQNSRHEQTKNDNRPVFTDNYKHVGRMRGPSDLYNYAPPENNIPRPRHKDQNDRPRMSNYQNMWPSSVYSLPFRARQPQNFHSPDIFPAHAANTYDPSQSLQNQSMQHIQNSSRLTKIPDITYRCTSVGVNNQSSENAKTPRLRVKDVSSLNNNYIASNTILETHLIQPQQKKQGYFPYTSTAAAENNNMYNKETHGEIVNFEGSAVGQSFQHYRPQTNHMTPVSNEQQYIRVPGPVYEQNGGYTRENQYQFNTGQQIEQQSTETYNRSSYPGLPVQLTNNENIHMSKVHNSQGVPSNMPEGNERVTGQFRRNSCESNVSVRSDINTYGKENPNKNSAITLLDLIDSSKISTVSQFERREQLTPPTAPQGPRFSPVTPPGEPITESVTSIPVSGQNISTVQITIPHGESTVISLVNSSFIDSDKKSASSVLQKSEDAVVITERNDTPLVSTAKVSVATTCQGGLESPRTGHTCKTSSRAATNLESSHLQLEPAVGCRINEESITGNFVPEGCRQVNIKETVCQNLINDCLIAPKKEEIDLKTETPVIKIEDDSAVEESTKEKPEEVEQDVQTEEMEEIVQTEDVEQVVQTEQVEQIVQTEETDEQYILHTIEPSSKDNEDFDLEYSSDNSDSKPSGNMVKAKNWAQETDTQTGRKNDDENESEEDGEEKCQKVVKLKDKFQSKISRSKLNMLINFLDKEQKPVNARKNSVKNKFEEKKGKSKPDRRKISKANVVRNKSNKREMVSLVSSETSKFVPKDARSDNGNNSEENVKIKGCGNGEAENSNSSENREKSEKHSENKRDFRESIEVKKLESFKNISNDKKSMTSEETNIINVMRAFQNLKNHFCANCDLSSPVGSIWINVVSGELRCLNCFKKMMTKPEDSVANSRKNIDGVNVSKSESSLKATESNNKCGSNHEKKIDSEKVNVDVSHTSIKDISKIECGNDKKVLEVRVKEEVMETQNNEENIAKETMELPSILKRRASDADVSLQKGKLAEESKRVKSIDIMEKTTKDSSHQINSSKHSISKNDIRRERNSVDSKTTVKELKEYKESKRRASEELIRPELKHKEEKSYKEESIKKENKKRSNSTPVSSTPHKVRIVEEPTKEHKKGEEETAKQNKKKDFQCQKDYDEHSKKEKKIIDFSDHQNKKITTLKSVHDHSKPKERDTTEAHKKKITFKENSSKRQSEEQHSSSKHIKKESDHEKTKTTHSERKEKFSKTSHSKEESQDRKDEHKHRKLTERHEEVIKPHKDKSTSKPKEKHIDKDSEKSHEHRKEHREKKDKRDKIVEDVDKKKKKIEDKRMEKSQKERKITEQFFSPKKKVDKAVGCSFEEILRQMDTIQRAKKETKKKAESGSLMDILIKKTKKLSWSLIHDAPQ